MTTPLELLQSVLCDPEGKCCINGSDEDRRIVDEALAALAAAPAAPQVAHPPAELSDEPPAVEWLRACLIARSGPAFMPSDAKKSQQIIAYIDALRAAACRETNQ